MLVYSSSVFMPSLLCVYEGRPWMPPCREYYEKGGELFPGQKGLSLPADQWAKLEAALPRLEAALGAEAGGSGQ